MLTQINSAKVNASAIKRILGLPQSRKIEILKVADTFVAVRYSEKGQPRHATLFPEQFDRDFEQVRQAGAKECIARPYKRGPWGEMFLVTGAKGDEYYVEVSQAAIACTCEDWCQHETICKHGYAVLSLVGVSSLEGYLAARSRVAFAAPKVPAFVPEYRQPARKIGGISID